MDRHALADAEWASVHMMLQQIFGIWKNREDDLRRFVEAVVWICRTGTAWADLPARFGNCDAVRQRYRRWAQRGVWERLFGSSVPVGGDGVVLIDATICKAHRSSSGARGGAAEEIGVSRGGITSKIHAATDLDGRALRLVLTGGNVNDCTQFEALLWDLPMTALVADRGYDTDKIRSAMAQIGVTAVIPTRRNRKVQIEHDRTLYAKRHAVENFFLRLKDYYSISRSIHHQLPDIAS